MTGLVRKTALLTVCGLLAAGSALATHPLPSDQGLPTPRIQLSPA